MKRIIGSIVVYNSEWSLLKKTIESFLTAAPSAQIVIWDNSANSNIKKNLSERFESKVTYLSSNHNIGYGSGHNQVFNLFPSDYFCIINPDVVIGPNVITDCVDFLEANPQFGLTSCSILNPDGSPQPVHRTMPTLGDYIIKMFARLFRKTPPTPPPPESSKARLFYPIISGCFMVFSSMHYRELGGFDERFFLYFEDYDLSLRSFLKKKSIVLKNISIVHSWGKGSHKRLRLFLLHAISGLKFYNKWGVSSKKALEVNAMAYKLNHPT